MFFDSFSELSTFDRAASIALYVTLGILVFIGICAIIVKKMNKPELKEKFGQITKGMIVGYAIGLITILMFLKINEYYAEGDIVNKTFIPMVSLFCAIFVLAILVLIFNLFVPHHAKLIQKIALWVTCIAFLVIFIILTVDHYKTQEIDSTSEIYLYVFTALLIAIIATIALVFGKKYQQNDTKSLVYGAICIAMSFALSYIRFLQMPSGGSITFASLLPIMIYCYIFGARKGVMVCIIYGVLQFIQSPWFYHPVQFLLDYPIAFGAIGLAGIFHERDVFKKAKYSQMLQFICGAILVVILRYLAHVVSGIFVFGSGDPENYSATGWSFMYNTYTFVDMAIVIVAGSMMFASKNFLRLLDSAKPELK